MQDLRKLNLGISQLDSLILYPFPEFSQIQFHNEFLCFLVLLKKTENPEALCKMGVPQLLSIFH